LQQKIINNEENNRFHVAFHGNYEHKQ